MKTVLITGGAGMLACEVARVFSERYGCDVHAPSHGELDVTDSDVVQKAVEGLRPDVVVHTAARHVDPCEEDPAEAYRVNSWASRGLARACASGGAALVYVSTCGLFGDEVRAYCEYDEVALKTVYAKSKYRGEEAVRSHCERHFIVRPGWLFGGSTDHAKNFVARRYEEARGAAVVCSAFDKQGSPTWTQDLAHRIGDLIDSGEFGTYHVANAGGCSRAGYVKQIVASFGLQTAVEEVDSSHYPRKAQVPDCEILSCLNSGFLGLPALPPWQEAIDRYVRSTQGA